MPDFSQRSYEPEIMDDFSIADDGLRQTLQEIEFINRWLGGDAITVQGVKELLSKNDGTAPPLSIADLGCGSGQMLRLLKKNLPGKQLKLVGIDANPAVIDFAKKKAAFPEEKYRTENIFSDAFRNARFDIALNTLFLHHFTDEEIVGILRQLKEQTTTGAIINDLHRHWLAYHSISVLTRLFSRSYMTRYDAKLSVLRAFSKKELIHLITQAGWENYSIEWKWAFRWKVVLWK